MKPRQLFTDVIESHSVEFATDGLGCATDRPRAGRLETELLRGARCFLVRKSAAMLTARLSDGQSCRLSPTRCGSLTSRAQSASPRFCVRSLLDLLKTRIGILNPIACFVDFSRIDWDRARNRLGSRHQLSVKLHRFRAFDWKFPVMPESVERVKHGLGFNGAHPAATHGVVEHAVAILPWPLLVPVRDIVQHGSISIFSFEWPAHERPEVARNGRPIDNRSDRERPRRCPSDLYNAIQLTVSWFAHPDSTWSPARHCK